MDSHCWNLGVYFVHRSLWTHLYPATSPRARSILYQPVSNFLILDDHSGAGWCWIDQQFFWERIFSFCGIICIALLQSLTIAFVSLDMLALIILYTTLFCYIRIQSNQWRKASPISDQTLLEMPSYNNNLGKPGNNKLSHPPSASNQANNEQSMSLSPYYAIQLRISLSLCPYRLFGCRNFQDEIRV
jgi:hypothetical protein